MMMTTCRNREEMVKPYPYTHKYRNRHGKWCIAYRRNGKAIRLKGEPGTAEFQASYDAAKALVEGGGPDPSATASAKPQPLTFRWLTIDYFKSSQFRQLGATTQDERRRLLEHCLRRPTSRPGYLFGDYPARALEAKHVRALMEDKAKTPNAANHRLKALRVLFNWAVENEKGGVVCNPARDIRKLKITGDGHHSWTAEEREQYKAYWAIGTMARLTFDMFWHLGQRIGDVRSFGPRHVKNGKMCFTQEKNRELPNPTYLELTIVPELQASLEATKTGELRFLVNEAGYPFASKKSFANWFRKRCQEAGLPERCSAHGLRKAAAAYHADLGASASELMAVFGWKSLRVAETYVRAADQRRNAARALARAARAAAKPLNRNRNGT